MKPNKLSEADALESMEDPRYFIENFLFIIDKQRKKVPLILNPPQSRYYQNKSLNDLILKARKEGFSTLIEALFLHACIFGTNENCVTMAHTWDDTVIHMDRVKFFLDTMGLPDVKFKIPLDKENQREIFFPHSNSRYWIGTAGSVAFGRGRDITKLHLSEVAHYQDQKVITGVMEACVQGAWKVFETTANGVGEAFHRLWKEAEDPQAGSPWKNHFSPWFEDPTNRIKKPEGVLIRLKTNEEKMMKTFNLDIEQILFYRNKEAEMTEKDKIVQEHPCTAEEAFLKSGRPVFNLEKIKEKKDRIKGIEPFYIGDLENDGKEIKFRKDKDGYLKIWKMPRVGMLYLVPGDVSEGVQGGDWSVAPVYDRSSWEQVAQWRGRVDPGEFGRIMVQIGYFFNNAILIPENNNHGWATIEAILSEKYPHLFETTDIWPGETKKYGFPTNEKTKGLIITSLRNSIDDDTGIFNDPTTLGEYETFIQNEKTGRLEAQKNCYDDCVMSNGIGIYCLKFMTVDASYAERELRKASISAYGQNRLNSHNERERRSSTGYR